MTSNYMTSNDLEWPFCVKICLGLVSNGLTCSGFQTRAVLSPRNRAKSYIFWYVKPVGNFIRKIAIERENSHFRQPHSHLTRPQQRTPTNIGIRLNILPETIDYISAADSIYLSPCFLNNHALKTRASTLNDSTQKTVFNAKMAIQGHLIRCQWKPIGGQHTQT